jgi:hypothetical protein
MSDLDNVVALSVTVACTVGLELLMFPTGLTEVMVTPLEPPRVGPLLAPDLVLGLALPEVLLLLGLPMRTPFFNGRFRCSRISTPRAVSHSSNNQESRLAYTRPPAPGRSFGGPGNASAHQAAEG